MTSPSSPLPSTKRRTKVVATTEALTQLVADYSHFDAFAFDVETRGTRSSRALPGQRKDKDPPALDVRTNEIWCLSLAGPGRSDVIAMDHPSIPPRHLMRAQVFDALGPLLFSDRVKINQNIKFDLLSLAKYYGQVPPPPYRDTHVLAFLRNENLPAYGLGALSQRYVGYTYAEKLGEEAWNADFERAVRYSIVDAKNAWMLWRVLSPQMTDAQRDLFDLEMSVLEVLLAMHTRGAYVNVERMRAMMPDLEQQLAAAKDKVRLLSGKDFPDSFFNSPKQRTAYFFDELGMKVTHRTPKDSPSTNAQALRKMAVRNKTAAALLEHSEIGKMLNTYVKGYLPHVDEDSRIRCSFNQALPKTGRFSSSQPNLQNIPIRAKENVEARTVRRLFCAPRGYVLVVADFSQIELRVLAHYSKDRLLLRAYREEIDLHTQTASLIYKVPMDEVTKDQRAIGKNANFAFAYEGSPGVMVERAGINQREAERVHEEWHRTYPAVQRWGRQTKSACYIHRYVETLYGRRRRLPEIRSANPQMRRYAERQAVNHPIQGTAADLAKIAMVQIHDALLEYDAHLVLQVHDEFIVETAENEADEVVKRVRDAMENIEGLDGKPALTVPLVADINVGTTWGDTK